MNRGSTFLRVQRAALRGLLAGGVAASIFVLGSNCLSLSSSSEAVLSSADAAILSSSGTVAAEERGLSPAAAAVLAAEIASSASQPLAKAPTTRNKRTRTAFTGLASFYGTYFHGRRTASGEIFNKNSMVAAHPRYPMGTRIRVTNLSNRHVVIVRIVDRGPTVQYQRSGVIIDLSEGAASKLGMIREGRVQVALEILPGENAKG